MGRFDFDAAARWASRLPASGTLARRPDGALPFADERRLGGQGLLLDTCVYLDQLQGRTPLLVERLVESRQVNHSTVAVTEMMHAVGALDPQDPRTSSAVAAIGAVVKAMPAHRIVVPDADVTGRAALLAGILCRLQGYGRDDALRALSDCTLFLQAQKLGLVVLTANIGDFDILLQLVPGGRVLLYRRAGPADVTPRV